MMSGNCKFILKYRKAQRFHVSISQKTNNKELKTFNDTEKLPLKY